MNKHSITDYLGYTLIRAFGPILRILPKGAVFFLGEVLGDLCYLIDIKGKRIVYSNIRVALADTLDIKRLLGISRWSYCSFFQCLIEVFLIPLIDKEYFDKYITKLTGIPAHVADDPLFCVIRGLGTAVENLEVFEKALIVK